MTNKILVVDDDPVSLKLVQSQLVAGGYDVVTTINAEEGLKIAKKELPALVITDFLMPEMDGFVFYKELKKDQATAAIPVVILTARGRTEDSFMVSGVDGFLSKPVDTQKLLSQVRQLTKFTPVPKIQEPKETPQPAPPAPPQKVEEAPQKKHEEIKTAAVAPDSRKKVLLFGNQDSVTNGILQQLTDKNCQVVIIKEEARILPEYLSLDPSIIFLQFNAETQTPVDQIVGSLNDQIKKRFKELSAKNKQTEKPVIPSNIILFKTEEEKGPGSSSEAGIADIESLIQRCQDNGAAKYIGLYSAASFVPKIKEFLS